MSARGQMFGPPPEHSEAWAIAFAVALLLTWAYALVLR